MYKLIFVIFKTSFFVNGQRQQPKAVKDILADFHKILICDVTTYNKIKIKIPINQVKYGSHMSIKRLAGL